MRAAAFFASRFSGLSGKALMFTGVVFAATLTVPPKAVGIDASALGPYASLTESGLFWLAVVAVVLAWVARDVMTGIKSAALVFGVAALFYALGLAVDGLALADAALSSKRGITFAAIAYRAADSFAASVVLHPDAVMARHGLARPGAWLGLALAIYAALRADTKRGEALALILARLAAFFLPFLLMVGIGAGAGGSDRDILHVCAAAGIVLGLVGLHRATGDRQPRPSLRSEKFAQFRYENGLWRPVMALYAESFGEMFGGMILAALVSLALPAIAAAVAVGALLWFLFAPLVRLEQAIQATVIPLVLPQPQPVYGDEGWATPEEIFRS